MDINKLSRNDLIDIVDGEIYQNRVFEKLGQSREPNSRTRKKIKLLFNNFGLDLNELISKNIFVDAECPVCNKSFKNSKSKTTTTCSHSCANTFFKTGENHPNYKGTRYTQICFKYHKKECIICKENKIVSVHHYDNNHYNDEPKNLIPLCPTHHQYMHSKHKKLIIDDVELYISKLDF